LFAILSGISSFSQSPRLENRDTEFQEGIKFVTRLEGPLDFDLMSPAKPA
jgi:hypothetical protein